jgi:hypothetical protein
VRVSLCFSLRVFLPILLLTLFIPFSFPHSFALVCLPDRFVTVLLSPSAVHFFFLLTCTNLTRAHDTQNVRLIFAAVKETILQNAIKDSRILDTQVLQRCSGLVSLGFSLFC